MCMVVFAYDNNYVVIYGCLVTVAVLRVHYVSQPAECHMKMCLSWQDNMVSHTTCDTVADMLAGLMHVSYVYERLSGFLTVHPYLVLITLLFC